MISAQCSMDFSNLLPRPSTSSSAYFPLHRTQLHPRMHPFSSSSPSKSPFSQHKCLFLFASLFTIPFLFYLFSTARKVHHSSKFSHPTPQFYGVVIDSSDSVSSVRVYHLFGEMPLIAGSMRVPRVLVADDPEGAARVVENLVGFAKEFVPKKEWESTKVQLLASVGGGLKERVLEACRRVLRESGFAFKDDWAQVVQDEDKGVYAWVAVNYGFGNLGSEPQKTTGVFLLGGSSLQVTFALKEVAPVQPLRLIKLSGVTYNLQTQSSQKVGQDAMWESLQELHKSRELMSFSNYTETGNPCLPKGYELVSNSNDSKHALSNPAANFTACKHAALAMLKSIQENCLHPPCNIVSASLLGLQGKPVSKESLFYASEYFGLFPRTSLSELEAAGHHYCEDDWDQLKLKHPNVDAHELSRYCFASAYTVTMLHDGLGVSMNDKRIGFLDRTGGLHTDWTLGAFILQSMVEPLELETDSYESVTYFSLFAFLLIALLAALFVLQWRKPQLKTIYDLEKGRYIVTRVPR